MNGHRPYTYDFEDFYGEKDYRNVFVTKLLDTHLGQCRSMPMLYKILADEIEAQSHLALAPNHLYIKHLDETGKWVNIELTNGHFSSDSWMITSLDISAESIQKGIYMKALTQKESIAYCLMELGFAYEAEYGLDSTALVITDKVLKHFPNCILALMHRANTYRHFGKSYIKKHGSKKTPYIEANYAAYKQLERELEAIGYREIPEDEYVQWVEKMERERKVQTGKKHHNQ
jgi:hypothetical protein